MEMLPLIMGIVSILLAGSVSAWFKFSIARTFKGMDEKLGSYDKTIIELRRDITSVRSELSNCVNTSSCSSCKKDITKKQDEVVSSTRHHDIDITKLQQLSISVDKLMSDYKSIGDLRSEFLMEFTRESYFLREMQSISSQIETIFAKINSIDGRLTSLRGQ